MAHAISALLVRGDLDEVRARELDLRGVALGCGITMAFVSHYFSAYWQARRGTKGTLAVPAGFPSTFPREAVLSGMIAEATGRDAPRFAIIMTDYFGGAGEQWACAFEGEVRVTGESTTINDALRALGVERAQGLDEFDTVGLGAYRSPPEELGRYVALCDELGV